MKKIRKRKIGLLIKLPRIFSSSETTKKLSILTLAIILSVGVMTLNPHSVLAEQNLSQEYLQQHDESPQNESDFKVVKVDGGVAITAYLGNEERFVPPNTINGFSVVKIGFDTSECLEDSDYNEFALDDDKGEAVVGLGQIKVVNLKNCENCSRINGFAFEQADNLVEVDDLGQCQEIGQYAFVRRKYLSKIDLSQCVEIENNAFDGCSNLIEVDLSECYDIGTNAFKGCTNLFSVKNLKCDTISDGAFDGCINLEEIHLGDCTEIGEAAFRNCPKLTELDMRNCTLIGNQAFYNCEKLIFEDEELENLNPINIGQDAFKGYTGITAEEILEKEIEKKDVDISKQENITESDNTKQLQNLMIKMLLRKI